jgi:hypothetical protein
MEKPIGQPLSSDVIESHLGGDYQQITGIVVHVDDLNAPSDPLAERFSIIVFLPGIPRGNPVGHFCLLSEIGSEGLLEWFDSTAQEIPPQVRDYAERRGKRIVYCNKALQALNTNTCGKWCIARLQSLPTSLGDFYKLFENKHFSPDEVVDKLIVLKWKQ